MKLVSWNVNGLRACVGKGFSDFFEQADADAFCLQETKLQAGQLDFAPEGYHSYWNYAQKKGYSGTAVFLRQEPLEVRYGLEPFLRDEEGRLITAELEPFYLLCLYTPPTPRTASSAWITAWPGRMPSAPMWPAYRRQSPWSSAAI